MILAKARVLEGRDGGLWVGLMFPTGFDPEEVLQDSVRANDTVSAEAVRCAPRRGNMSDMYREFEVSFPALLISQCSGTGGTIRITGKFRRGIGFTASVVRPNPA